MKEYRDHYFLKAKQENYPARSVYKLKEIDGRFKIFRKGMKVLDLGAAPRLVVAWRGGTRGRSGQGIGLRYPEHGHRFSSQCGIPSGRRVPRSEAFERQLAETGPFHVVMSDMAPQTTGTKFTDQARSLELCLEALAVAEKYLVKGGSFVVKIFMGPDVGELLKGMRPRFARVTSFKPQSSRVESKETFFVGLGFKGKEADGARD